MTNEASTTDTDLPPINTYLVTVEIPGQPEVYTVQLIATSERLAMLRTRATLAHKWFGLDAYEFVYTATLQHPGTCASAGHERDDCPAVTA